MEIKTYTGEVIKPVGVAFVNCQYKNYNFHGKLYILMQRVELIFCREWLREIKMDWADIKQIKVESSKQLKITNYSLLLKNFSNLKLDKYPQKKDTYS